MNKFFLHCKTISRFTRVKLTYVNVMAVLCVLACGSTIASEQQSLSNSATHHSSTPSTSSAERSEFLLQPYPEARRLYHTQAATSEYLLALSPYRKVGGVWRTPEGKRVAGELTRSTLELPATHSFVMGYQFYRDQLVAAGAQALYECDARDCGTSNSWANNHFKVLQLYGLDQHQRYGVFSLGAQASGDYVVLYAVRRGNNRVYMQIEQVRDAVDL